MTNPFPTMRLSQHFKLWELCRSDTADRLQIDNDPVAAGDDIVQNLRDVALNILEPVRQAFKKPFIPNSGYRSFYLNKVIGGAKNSQHVKGQAVDFELPGIADIELARWIADNLEFDQLILECYQPGFSNSGWVHCSYRTDRNRGEILTYSGRRYFQGLQG